MATNRVIDLAWISHQLDNLEELGDNLSKLDALLEVLLLSDFEAISENSFMSYIGTVADILKNGKILNEISIKQLLIKKANQQ